MKLLPLDTPELLELAAGWLARKENHQWLDFGGDITPALLRVMAQRPSHFMRVYTADADETPIGILGLNAVSRAFGTATLWAVAGDKGFRRRGQVGFAATRFMGLAFRELGLRAINTWAVEINPSLRAIERVGFRYVGRLRQSHCIDGRLYDRLLFDLLAGELRELERTRPQRAVAGAGRGLAARPATDLIRSD